MTISAFASPRTVSDAPPPVNDTQKQPGVLYMLFGTEAWERFSYYGMRAILGLYMVKALMISQSQKSIIYGAYTGLVYLTPLLGGYVADRFIGYRNAILIGGIIMAAGQFLLTVPTLPFFYAGLAALILGNGFFKPNISTLVGTLYKEGDPRRDRGFTIFYMGINLGAMVSPIVCGEWLGENPNYGFAWGFRAAGIGMIVGTITFLIGQKWLGDRGKAPERRVRTDANAPEAHTPLTTVEKRRMAAIFLVGLFVIVFWMAFEQAGNTMTDWADKNTDRNIFGWDAKASIFQAVNPIFILALAPIISMLWKVLDERKAEPSTPMKMVWGLFLLGAGFIPLVFAATLAGTDGKASWVWLILAYFLHTVGELCLSPVGLSFVTKLAPKRYAALMMGVWFLAVFAGNFLSGLLGALYSSMSHVAFFGLFVVTSFASAFLLFLLLKPVKSLMGGIH